MQVPSTPGSPPFLMPVWVLVLSARLPTSSSSIAMGEPRYQQRRAERVVPVPEPQIPPERRSVAASRCDAISALSGCQTGLPESWSINIKWAVLLLIIHHPLLFSGPFPRKGMDLLFRRVCLSAPPSFCLPMMSDGTFFSSFCFFFPNVIFLIFLLRVQINQGN